MTAHSKDEGRARSDISFERAAEMAEKLLELHERGLQLAEAGPDAAEDWAKNAADYRSICYVTAPILAVKLLDALLSTSSAVRGMREALEWIDYHYANQDMGHLEFRALAGTKVAEALSLVEGEDAPSE